MTGEQLTRWMDESDLTATQLADHVGLDADAVFSQCFSPNSVSVEFETALRGAFPDDLDLTRLLSACPHCHDGLAGDDSEYNEPIYCQHCCQGLRLELARIQGKVEGLTMALDDCNVGGWIADYVARLRINLKQYQELRICTERRLAELEAA